MIPTKQERQIIKLGNFPEMEMGIAKGQESWLIYLLRNGMYKFKIRSPLREYIVNAQDEHRKYKVARPVEITLPSPSESNIHIRDFGAGLLPEVRDEKGELSGGINYFFGKYGASDKRETNDEAGFMGIGNKSGFAYTKEFTVVSYKDGKKYTFLVFTDEKTGKVALLDTSNTDETNGIDIVIPVNPADRQLFRDEVISLTQYFKVKPIINWMGKPQEWQERPEPLIVGDNWRVYGDNTESVAIMGEIAYPVRSQDIEKSTSVHLSEWEENLIGAGLELDFAIGEIHMTTNREELELDATTLEALRKRLKEIRKAIVTKGKKSFEKCKTLIEAKTLFYEMLMTGSIKSLLKEFITEIEWNGFTLKDNVIDLQNSATLLMYTRKKKTIVRAAQETNLKCVPTIKLYLDDTPDTDISYRRRANTILENATGVQILRVRDEEKLKQLGIDPVNLPKYSEVKQTALVYRGNSGYGTGPDEAKRSKHTRKVFKLIENPESYPDAASDNWEVVKVDDDTEGLFIPIERFRPVSKLFGYTRDTHAALVHILNQFRTLHVQVPTIYGVKKSEKNTFDDWFKRTVEVFTTDDIALKQEFVGRQMYFTPLRISVKNLPDTHLVRQYHDIRQKATRLDHTTIQAKIDLLAKIEKSWDASHEIKDAQDKMFETYPVLRWVKDTQNKERAQDLLEYILDVDVLNARRKK